jgi:hypothetical protein
MEFKMPFGTGYGWLAKDTGEVIDSDVKTNTSVHTEIQDHYGKNGIFTDYGRKYKVPIITSKLHHKSSLWLRNSEGKETPYVFNQEIMPVRKGNQVVVVSGALKGKCLNGAPYHYVYNKTTNSGKIIMGGFGSFGLGLIGPIAGYMLASLLIGVMLSYFVSLWFVLLIPILMFASPSFAVHRLYAKVASLEPIMRGYAQANQI